MGHEISQETSVNQTDLYVSPELYLFEESLPHRLARDFQWGQIMYRRLDAKYFGWLHQQMSRLAKALNRGMVESTDYTETFERFAWIHEWVLNRFGEEKLEKAIKQFNDKEYRGPVRFGGAIGEN